MTYTRLLAGCAAALALLSSSAPSAIAQGITTGALTGTVTDASGNPVASAQIQVVNRATGFSANATTRDNGLYFVQGLEVGGPYSVTVRRIGFQPRTRDNITIALSQASRVDVQLSEQVATLATVEVRAVTSDIAPTTMGTKTTVSDSALQRIPTLNRSLNDFIRLAPQVTQTSSGGFSAGGMSNRMNNIQIDGSTERDVFGLGATGQPGAEVNARSISLEAVKEIQVLLAPFDVRQGNFGGLLLNAVTKAGTNQIHGTVYHGFRNQTYGRNVPALRSTLYDRSQWAFTLGGPIIKDRLHFFVAPEFQQEHLPVSGPFRGQVSASSPLQIADADLDRFESIMNTTWGNSPGTAGAATNTNPLNNVFGRLDWRVNDIHRVVFRYNYSDGERLRQENGRAQNRAVYSSNFNSFSIVKKAPVLQIYSSFAGGSFNELFLGYNNYSHRRLPLLVFPQVTVTVPRVGGGNATIVGGADQFSMKNELDTETYELTDNFTIPLGNHNVTIGTRNELVKLRNQFNQSSFGIWTFTNLTNFQNGVAGTFRKSFILQNDGNVLFDALQTALYVQDQWQARPNLNFTLGLRADVSSFLKDVGYSAPIDSAYGRRTDDIPKRAVQFSPRVGFNWDIGGNQINQLRGGVGLFVGTPPYVWMENAYINNGLTTVFLNCNTGGSTDPAPVFRPDASTITACGNGAGSAPIGAVNFLDKDLKFPQPFRGTIGFDRQLPGNLVATVEALYSKTLNQLFFVNRNLVAPRGVDKRGRVLYGDTIRTNNGQALPTIQPRVLANGGASRFAEAFDIINQSKDYAYNLTFQLQKRYSNNWEGMFAYTRSRARDVQSFTSSTHVSNWRFGRTYAGNQLDPYTSVSLFDQPHKFVMTGTRTITPFGDLATDISVFLQRVSGPPFDYVYGAGSTGSGDLNADGSQGNDLIYVPRDARDPNEIRFNPSGSITAAQQADAFETFINSSKCLSAHRGEILSRNVCRNPTQTTIDLSLRQNLPIFGRQRASVQLDFFNIGNAINADFGKIRSVGGFNNVFILTHVGQTTIDPKTADPIFTFNVNQREFSTGDSASDHWRAQMSFRYSF